MSTAIASLGTSTERGFEIGRRTASANKPAKVFVHKESRSKRVAKGARHVLVFGGLVTLVLAILAVGVFFHFYNYYAAIVDHRVQSGIWQSRAGIYAAPVRLMKDQKASLEAVAGLLKQSGYVEGNSTNAIWNGTFTVRENAIEIRPNEIFSRKAEPTTIKFQNNRVASIKRGGESLKDFNIEPELLTGRSETKRGENSALKFEDIPENLKNAILMAEDQRFFEHYGIDPRGILRAFKRNLGESSVKQGGSTITQQLVKNTFLSPERTYSRKFSEAFLALALERRMSKQDIFTLYCTEIYLGQYGSTGVHGIEQAARVYFNKSMAELDLNETASIAAMIKNPNRFAPHKNEENARTRRESIIAKMADTGLIERSEAEAATVRELALAPAAVNVDMTAPYFVDSVTNDLTTRFQADYLNTNFNRRVYTTIDTHLQDLAEKSVKTQLAQLDKVYAKKGANLQAVIVAMNPRNGHILAMVGGRDYAASQFNRAVDAKRQPGSTFKPFVYAAALEAGMTPVSLQTDEPTEFQIIGRKPYKPSNYGDSYQMASITMKTALAKSSNVVAVKTALRTGLHAVDRKAEQFGFENIQPYPSMALGAMDVTPLQLAAAYSTFANGGRRVRPTFINAVVSSEDQTLYAAPEPGDQIINERTAFMITDMLKAVVERGTARKARGALGRDVVFAGKTGSSKDGWFVGYTPNLVTVAWIGTDDQQDLRSTGGELALPLWIDFMKSVVQARPEFGGEAFQMPRGMEIVTVDPTTGMVADAHCPMSETVAITSSQVSRVRCLLHQPMPEIAAVPPEWTTEIPAAIERSLDAPPEAGPEIRPSLETEFKEINGVLTVSKPPEPETNSPTRESTKVEKRITGKGALQVVSKGQ